MRADQIDELLSNLRPGDARRTSELFPPARRTEVFERILSTPRKRPSGQRGNLRQRGTLRRREGSDRRGPVILSTLGAAAVVVLVVLALLTSSAVRPTTAHGIAFRELADGAVIARVTDPFAADAQLKAAFAKHGFNITLKLLPVSPSIVGTVIYTSGAGIEPLQGGHCVSGGGACPIGLRISSEFTGHGYITLGRPARAGEVYESTASAFAPGEALHCSGLLGAQVAAALAKLRAERLAVQWREEVSSASLPASSRSLIINGRPPMQNYIWSADMIRQGRVSIWTEPTPWPATVRVGARFNQGC
jgi:hypothetical protein